MERIVLIALLALPLPAQDTLRELPWSEHLAMPAGAALIEVPAIDSSGFAFELVAEGRESMAIDRKSSCGNTSYGDGQFQGFNVCLSADLAGRIVPGAAYTLRPKQTNQEYFWTVLPDAVLRRPESARK